MMIQFMIKFIVISYDELVFHTCSSVSVPTYHARPSPLCAHRKPVSIPVPFAPKFADMVEIQTVRQLKLCGEHHLCMHLCTRSKLLVQEAPALHERQIMSDCELLCSRNKPSLIVNSCAQEIKGAK